MKELINKDLDKVFFNTNEFAEDINLNGVNIKGILAPIKYEAVNSFSQDSSILGISSNKVKLYYKADATAEVFFISQQIVVNGEYYTVEYKEVEQGLVILTLTSAGAR